MYEAFYGLTVKPFSLLPDPEFLYLGRQHTLAYSMLEYGLMSQAGFTVITGDIGCGKTTLIRHLLNRMDEDITVGLISNTHKNFGQLLQWILLSFGLDYKDKGPVELSETLANFLIDEYANGRRVLLIIDESQNLSAETLEELRMLSNINADSDQIIQLILVGQPQLKDKLEQPELQQFAQRVLVNYHLRPLSEQETHEYILHRIIHAGGMPDTFTEEARQIVYDYTEGVPRLINGLCDMSLVYGYAIQQSMIDAELVLGVIEDKEGGIDPKKANKKNQPNANHSTRSPDQKKPEDPTTLIFDRDMARELFASLKKE